MGLYKPGKSRYYTGLTFTTKLTRFKVIYCTMNPSIISLKLITTSAYFILNRLNLVHWIATVLNYKSVNIFFISVNFNIMLI